MPVFWRIKIRICEFETPFPPASFVPVPAAFSIPLLLLFLLVLALIVGPLMPAAL